MFASSYEQLIASIKNSAVFITHIRSCDKLLAPNSIKLNSQNQFSDSSIHKYDFKICFPWILKLDIHCFCRHFSQLTYSLEYLWKAYTRRVWTASKWSHLNTKMNICSLPSFYFIVFYEVFAQLWLQSCLYRLLGLKCSQKIIVAQHWSEIKNNWGKQVPGKKAGRAFKILPWQLTKNRVSFLLTHRLPT